jgi:glutamyl-tRNA reductase
VSYVAVELAKKIFDSLKGKSALLVGAGEMAELALRHFLDAGVKQLAVCNRTRARAEDLAASFGARVIPFEDLGRRIGEADIIVCSTGAPDYVIGPAEVRAALEGRRNRPFFLIDISVPRQIDPAVGAMDNVYLFDMDDLHRVIESNMREREREAQLAEAIIEHEVQSFFRRLDAHEIGPAISELKGRLNDLALAEYERQRRRLGALTPDQEEAIREILLPSIINKIAHPMITHMREEARGGADPPASIWRRIFRLGSEGE